MEECGSEGVRELGTTKYTKHTKWEAESEWPCRVRRRFRRLGRFRIAV